MVFFIYLAAAAWQDVRRREISGWFLCCFGAVFFILQLCRRIIPETWGIDLSMLSKGMSTSLSLEELAGGMAIGAALLFIGQITKGAIGTGDGLFFLVSGCYLGFYKNLFFLCISLFLSSGAGLLCLVWGRRKGQDWRGKKLPFLVFAFLPGILITMS